MKIRTCLFIIVIVFLSSFSVHGAVGWTQISSTTLSSICPSPSPGGSGDCGASIADWAGGAADTKRNRLMSWSGGHSDYAGNQIYGLQLGASPGLSALTTHS